VEIFATLTEQVALPVLVLTVIPPPPEVSVPARVVAPPLEAVIFRFTVAVDDPLRRVLLGLAKATLGPSVLTV
jgi:hypothetical protein